ncbi:hypothetical protein [Asticcacaulis sp. EMRT-3]|uniref:hypothetical protein n=1 Tax=Asticcacaulis sp. EMRT-3 TaxID=3040349 RepID=UPI0024AFCC58|nr:hypothetical protein [Asticcacaulis sp. EMRT-3]MDI7775023.1 hypothetical protein [Asticcacaulis sp. EMRT-3]
MKSTFLLPDKRLIENLIASLSLVPQRQYRAKRSSGLKPWKLHLRALDGLKELEHNVSFSALAFFCEDVRPEANGSETIVGLMPDNLIPQIQTPPPGPNFAPVIPKLCIYLRIGFTQDSIPSSIIVSIASSNGTELAKNDLGKDVINMAKAEFQNFPLVSIKSIVTIGNFPLFPGIMKVTVEADGKEYIAGLLKINNPG